jgi:phage gp46-like protein
MSLIESVDFVIDKKDDYYDLSIDDKGDFTTSDFFDTAIIVSLTAERRASEKEISNPLLRRGWIGNESNQGFEIGSKIWLYHQARKNRDNLNGIQTAVENCLSWMLDMKIVSDLTVQVQYTMDDGAAALITAYRSGNKISKYYPLWEKTGL